MIYLDNNATTPLLPEVLTAMRPHLEGLSGNPASAHGVGRQARRALEDAREEIAGLLGAWPDEVVFTSGATESNNLALAGAPPGRPVSSAMEHPSIVEPLRQLERAGFPLTWLAVDEVGRLPTTDPGPVGDLFAIQLANHEVGTIQEVAAWAEGGRLHCDATQAVGKIHVDFHRLGATTLAFSGHKFHGPRGIGGLLVRRGTSLRPLMQGGHQQRGVRPGTEPVALVVGLATALRRAMEQREVRWRHVLTLRGQLLAKLAEVGAVLNGPAEGGIPHTVNVSFPGLRGDLLMMSLDLEGVACSTGSACSSGSLLPSPVLRAMGVGPERLASALRFSLSPLLSLDEVLEAGRRIVRVVRRLRSTGPGG